MPQRTKWCGRIQLPNSSSFAELCDLPSRTSVDVEVSLKSRGVRSVALTVTVAVPLRAGVRLGCGILPSVI